MREYLKIGAFIAGIILGSQLDYTFPKDTKNPKQGLETVVEGTKTVKTLSDNGIKHYMSMKTVEDILDCVPVKYAKYQGNGRTDVWDLLNSEKKPAIVFFYQNYKLNQSNDFSKRNAIILRYIFEKYADKINLICYNMDNLNDAEDTNFDRIAQNGILHKNPFSCPSFVLFSYFDLLNGETPDKNDGKIKPIDVLRGGPDADKYIKNLYDDLTGYWFPMNLFVDHNCEGKKVISRLNNTYKDWKDYPYQK